MSNTKFCLPPSLPHHFLSLSLSLSLSLFIGFYWFLLVVHLIKLTHLGLSCLSHKFHLKSDLTCSFRFLSVVILHHLSRKHITVALRFPSIWLCLVVVTNSLAFVDRSVNRLVCSTSSLIDSSFEFCQKTFKSNPIYFDSYLEYGLLQIGLLRILYYYPNLT